MFQKIAPDTSMLRTDDRTNLSLLRQVVHSNRSSSRTCSTVYLIEEKGKRLIIDSGDGKLPDFGFVPDICILTHGHFDHVRGVKGNWPLVLLHKKEFFFGGAHIEIPKNASENPMKPLKFGSHLLEFFHTPGHTDGSICVLDRKTGCLFSGDTKFAEGGYGRTDLGGSDEEMEKSLKTIDSIDYKLLCPGHGELEERK